MAHGILTFGCHPSLWLCLTLALSRAVWSPLRGVLWFPDSVPSQLVCKCHILAEAPRQRLERALWPLVHTAVMPWLKLICQVSRALRQEVPGIGLTGPGRQGRVGVWTVDQCLRVPEKGAVLPHPEEWVCVDRTLGGHWDRVLETKQPLSLSCSACGCPGSLSQLQSCAQQA